MCEYLRRYNIVPVLSDILQESVKEKVTRIILAAFRVSVCSLQVSNVADAQLFLLEHINKLIESLILWVFLFVNLSFLLQVIYRLLLVIDNCYSMPS